MTWTLLTISRPKDILNDAMYPLVGAGKNSIRLGPCDGQYVRVVPVRSIELSETYRVADESQTQVLLSVLSIKANLHITDDRVALVCQRYDKGGGWVGGAGALIMNLFSMIWSAARSHNKVLLGQVRYPWLASVGYHLKSGWLSDNKIAVTALDEDGTSRMRLELTLHKSVPVSELAADIASRAARFMLTASDSGLDPDERQKLESLVDPPPLETVKNQFSTWTFPIAFQPSVATAQIGLTSEGILCTNESRPRATISVSQPAPTVPTVAPTGSPVQSPTPPPWQPTAPPSPSSTSPSSTSWSGAAEGAEVSGPAQWWID